METSAHLKQGLHWLAATLVTILTTCLLAWLNANSTTAGMFFLVLVVWSASHTGIILSLYIAVLCAASFDYFFLPPTHTLQLAGTPAWAAMVSFALSCAVVSRLAERATLQARRAEQRQTDVTKLYALSQEMMLFEDADRLLRDLPGVIGRVFDLNEVAIFIRDRNRLYNSIGNTSESVKIHLQALAHGQSTALEPLAGYYASTLMLGLRQMGALAWRPDSLSPAVASAVCAQVSIAVARSIATEATARIEAAREGERLRTALIDSLTHELRTPLTSIRAAATTLVQGEGLDEESRHDMAKIIDEEAARLDLLIGEAVEIAEIDANVVKVKMSPQHPRALLEQAVEESRKILATHKVDFDIEDEDGSGQEPPAWFDPHLLSRVLRHLLENAARHTPSGTRITLTCKRSEDRLEFCVEDNGPGIDAMDLPLIFEKFYRGKHDTQHSKGSGMGLAICRAILRAHGGGIEASNIPGGGARFHFWVPRIEKEPSRNL